MLESSMMGTTIDKHHIVRTGIEIGVELHPIMK